MSDEVHFWPLPFMTHRGKAETSCGVTTSGRDGHHATASARAVTCPRCLSEMATHMEGFAYTPPAPAAPPPPASVAADVFDDYAPETPAVVPPDPEEGTCGHH